MKSARKRIVAVCRRLIEQKVTYVALLTVIVVGCLLPMNVYAAKQRYVLDFGDSHLRAGRGEVTTLFLKKTLKLQYPWVDLRRVDLRKVVLIAKSKKGRGHAQLRIGNRWSPRYRVDGNPYSFRFFERYTFDRIHFRFPSANDHGVWQIDLKGNFIVRKVVLVVDDRSWRHNNIKFYYR